MEDYTLSYLPKASALHFLRRPGPFLGRVVAVGDPGIEEPGLGRLPGARIEAERAAELFHTAALTGDRATESWIRTALPGADLVHFAVHGALLQEHPRFSYLALGGDTVHDGRLEMNEILAEIDLSETEMVVLSARDTARGRRTDGDDLIGPSRAFLYVGTPALVATLWPVGDEASAVLVKELYGALKAGRRPADALRQAQALLRGDPRYSAPYYWASYRLTGDPPALIIQPSDSPVPEPRR